MPPDAVLREVALRIRQRLRQALEPVYQGLAQRIGPQWLVQLEKERAAA